MTSCNLFVTNDSITDGIGSPLGVGGIGKNILLSGENGNWNLVDGIDWNLISSSLLLLVKYVGVVISPNLESILSHVLGVVKESLNRSSIWLMTHVD